MRIALCFAGESMACSFCQASRPRSPTPIDARQPGDDLVEAEFFACMDRALDSLPWEQKMAFVLSEIEGLSHEEIGRIEEAPLGTIKSRISRAKEKLRSLLPRAPE
jgi:RNA polymerase sigma-70 factor, ECF subfamily